MLYRLAEDKKNAPSALTRANSAHIHVRGTTLLRCSLARTAFLGANTPLLCNGSSRWQLLLLTRAPFRHHGSRGSFSLPPTLACTIRQFSTAGRPTYFPRSTPFCSLSTKSILFYAICQAVIWHGTGSVKDCQKDDLTSRATARVARTIPIYPVFHVNMYCTGDPGGRPGYHSQTLWHGTFHQEYSYISLPIVCTF